jgi:hypothetical protein
MDQAYSSFNAGINLFRKAADARKKANRLRAQRRLLSAGNRGIPSNALGATSSGAKSMTNLPHHNVAIREVFRATTGSYNPGDYRLELKILPYKWLRTSPYAPLTNIYEKARLNNYTISVYIPTMSPIAKASSSSWLAMDSTAVTGISSYEKILEQPGHKRGRGATRFVFKWRPIEPADYDYRELDNNFDNFDWGTLLFSVIGAVSEFPEVVAPVIEYKATYSFANLVDPTGVKHAVDSSTAVDLNDSIEVISTPIQDEIEELSLRLQQLKSLSRARSSVAPIPSKPP